MGRKKDDEIKELIQELKRTDRNNNIKFIISIIVMIFREEINDLIWRYLFGGK